jgi:GSCFA family protein
MRAWATQPLLLITFGVAEYWLDAESGEPLWRAPLKSLFDPSRHLLRVATVAEVLEALETMERLRERFLPQTKIVFTLSPQKQMGTYRPISPLTASSASKAILRAALDEFLRDHPQLNRSLFYFPGFEMVVDVMIDPLMDDNLHLKECEAQKIVAAFTRAFSELSVSGDPDGTVGDELIASIRAVESKNAEPQTATPRRRWPSIASWIGSRRRLRSRTPTDV